LKIPSVNCLGPISIPPTLTEEKFNKCALCLKFYTIGRPTTYSHCGGKTRKCQNKQTKYRHSMLCAACQ